MIKEIECLIHGRVQGVMFRDFARGQACRRHLTGTVENLADGSVRVMAQGDEPALQEFIKCLRRGSLFTRVESVAVSWRGATNQLDDFRIIS